MRTFTTQPVPSRSLARLATNGLKLNAKIADASTTPKDRGRVDFPNHCSECGVASNWLIPISTTIKGTYIRTNTLGRVCPMCAGNIANIARAELAHA